MSMNPPSDPKDAIRREITNAVVWTLLAAAFAAFMFLYANRPENDKKNFYLLAGVVGAVVTAVNGYNAWMLYNKSKRPPAAPK